MNPLLNKKYIKLRDLILASEGKTIEDELSLGCKIKFENKYNNFSAKEQILEGIYTILEFTPPCKEHKLPAKITVFERPGEITYLQEPLLELEGLEKRIDGFQILGPPIGRERVETTLKKIKGLTGVYYLQSESLKLMVANHTEVFKIEIFWEQMQPLHLQKEEVWDGLINILIQGK